jgi:hypothetical protein
MLKSITVGGEPFANSVVLLIAQGIVCRIRCNQDWSIGPEFSNAMKTGRPTAGAKAQHQADLMRLGAELVPPTRSNI